ncbi:HU family DNA-binding protein [Bacteroides sp.]|uniref:HU family DNA-binding protein n=1 Tax=Bacteroides sp. TaxID=29523 RepID=UPI003A919283
MTHRELIVAISYKAGYKIEVVEKIIDAYIDISIKEFKKKHSIKLREFGTLRFVHAIMRKGYNPLKMKQEIFKGKNKIKFIPSKALDKLINTPEEDK